MRGEEKIGRPDRIELQAGSDVAQLCKAVKKEFEDDLKGVSAARLDVSTACDKPEYLRPGQQLDLLHTTTDDTPLFIHAPAPAGGSEQASATTL